MKMEIRPMNKNFIFFLGVVFILGSAGVAQGMAFRKVEERSLRQEIVFEKNFDRYPTPRGIANFLKAGFPFAYTESDIAPNVSSYLASCIGTRLPGAIVGENLLTTFEPLTKNPGAPFVNWYMECVRYLADNYRDHIGNKEHIGEAEYLFRYTAIFTEEVIDGLKDTPCAEGNIYCQWEELRPPQKRMVVEGQIYRLLGPDSLLYRLFGLTDKAGFVEEIVNLVGNEKITAKFYNENPGSLDQALKEIQYMVLSVGAPKY